MPPTGHDPTVDRRDPAPDPLDGAGDRAPTRPRDAAHPAEGGHRHHRPPLVEADVPKILHVGAAASADDTLYRSRRRWLLESGLGTCYAAVDTTDEPCYVQWLMGEHDNAQIQSYFGGAFPILEPGTALLEGAFTPPAFRGKGIMGLAMSLIAERAADLGARYVVTVVGTENIASLKGCEKASFFPYLHREVTWSLMRRRVQFESVALA